MSWAIRYFLPTLYEDQIICGKNLKNCEVLQQSLVTENVSRLTEGGGGGGGGRGGLHRWEWLNTESLSPPMSLQLFCWEILMRSWWCIIFRQELLERDENFVCRNYYYYLLLIIIIIINDCCGEFLFCFLKADITERKMAHDIRSIEGFKQVLSGFPHLGWKLLSSLFSASYRKYHLEITFEWGVYTSSQKNSSSIFSKLAIS